MAIEALGFRIACDQSHCGATIDIQTLGLGHAVTLAAAEGWVYAPTAAAERAHPSPRMPLRNRHWCPDHATARGDAASTRTFVSSQAEATPPFAELLQNAVTETYAKARQAVIDQGGNPDEWTFDIDPDAPIDSIVITATPPPRTPTDTEPC